jgi:osomolarity two-component system sensor histidine kinase TcsA
MHGMLSANALLLDTTLTPDQLDLVNIIKDSGQVLLQIINDILDYSKLSSGSFSCSSDMIGIEEVLNSVVRAFQTILTPGVHFELHLSPNLPKWVRGDPLRYRQIVQNLVSNAVKFTEKGFIRIYASVQQEDKDESIYTIYTEVKDTGVGISQAAKSDLFTPFHQFDNSRTKIYKGTGLGLSISKSLVELMDGQIGYMPNLERKGSLFWFTATFKKIDHPDTAAILTKNLAPMSMTASNGPSSKSLREVFETKVIMLAEDNIINQKVMIMMLRSLGFLRIDTAKNGAEAVQLVKNSLKDYDLILMDINMPVVDGLTATTQIRSSGSQTPIIAITANALKGDREECIAKGMNDFIPKPVDKVFLSKILRKWLVIRQSCIECMPIAAVLSKVRI